MINLLPIVKNVNQRYDGDMCYYYNLVMNAPNAYGPYHNSRHMFHVPWEAYDGGIHMGLSKRDLRTVLVAAFMHDYDHTCKRNDDRVNIERAVRALDRYALEEDRPYLLDIRECIRATKFPYDTTEQFTDMQLLLRDADQSQPFSPVWIHSVLFALGQEMEMSHADMLRLQRPFLEKLKFHTLWGQNKFEPLIPQRLADVDEMIKIMEDHPIPEIVRS